jgi:dTDP-4-dehydrorhamnose 3,5-epimerase
MIEGVWAVPLDVHCDDRGYLIEIARRADDPERHGIVGRFGQVYLVGNVARGVVRAFHKHGKAWDWFTIGHGSAKVVLIDDRQGSASYGERMVLTIGERKPVLIAVPPGVFHGWMSLEDDTQLIGIASHTYIREDPDEVRVPADHFGDMWTIVGR